MPHKKKVYEVSLIIDIPTTSRTSNGAMKAAEAFLQEHLEKLHSGVSVKALSAERYLRHDEYYDREAFEEEISEAVEEDDRLYDEYIQSMGYSHDQVLGRTEYKVKEAEVLKKFYRQILERMPPKQVVYEIATQDDDLDKLFDKFPAKQIANDILVKRKGNPSEKQLESLINIYVNYLIEINKQPEKMEG